MRVAAKLRGPRVKGLYVPYEQNFVAFTSVPIQSAQIKSQLGQI